MRRVSLDAAVKYSWLALIVVVIIGVVLVVYPSGEVRSTCSGFQYFVFLSQKMTESGYHIELLNGPRDITVEAWAINGIKMSGGPSVKAGDSFILASNLDTTTQKTGEIFSYPFWLDYDIKSGIENNKDTAMCTGRVQ